MNRCYRPAVLLCAILVVFVACHRHEGLQTVSAYSFTNTTDARITFDIYGSRDDYNNNKNSIKQYNIEQGSTVSIPLEALRTYWVDWYNADYSLNNWADNNYSGNLSSYSCPKPEIAVAAQDDHYDISASSKKDVFRSVLLDGSGLSSTWQGTVNNEPGINGSHTFLLKKDFTGQYTFTDSAGMRTTKPILFKLEKEPVITVIIMDAQKKDLAMLYINIGSQPTPFAYYHGRDTLAATFFHPDGSGYLYGHPFYRQ